MWENIMRKLVSNENINEEVRELKPSFIKGLKRSYARQFYLENGNAEGAISLQLFRDNRQAFNSYSELSSKEDLLNAIKDSQLVLHVDTLYTSDLALKVSEGAWEVLEDEGICEILVSVNTDIYAISNGCPYFRFA